MIWKEKPSEGRTTLTLNKVGKFRSKKVEKKVEKKSK